MIIDFKYHLASLVAVFMALGIGIVIGSLVVGESFVNSVINEQESLVQRLESDYLALKKEAQIYKEEAVALRKCNEDYMQYIHKTLPALISGKLAGKRIAVVESIDAQTPGYFLDNLRLSGAEILLTNQLFDDTSLEVGKSILEQPLDALILVSWNSADQIKKLTRQIQSIIAHRFPESDIRVFNIITGGSIDTPAVTEHLDGVFYFDSADCVPQQAALIFALAENDSGLVVQEVSGF